MVDNTYIQNIIKHYTKDNLPKGFEWPEVANAYLSGVFDPEVGVLANPTRKWKETIEWKSFIPKKVERLIPFSPEESAIFLHNIWLEQWSVEEPTLSLVKDIQAGLWIAYLREYPEVDIGNKKTAYNFHYPIENDQFRVEVVDRYVGDSQYGKRVDGVILWSKDPMKNLSEGFNEIELMLIRAAAYREWCRQATIQTDIRKQEARDIVTKGLSNV